MSTTELMNRWLRERYSFDESKVNRDSDGKFADKSGGGHAVVDIGGVPTIRMDESIVVAKLPKPPEWKLATSAQRAITDTMKERNIPNAVWAAEWLMENEGYELFHFVGSAYDKYISKLESAVEKQIEQAENQLGLSADTSGIPLVGEYDWQDWYLDWFTENIEPSIGASLNKQLQSMSASDDQYSLAARMNRWLRERYAMPQPDEQSSLIADILYHTYGDNAGAMLDQVDKYAAKFDENKHKRDAAGRFAKKNESVAAIHDAIKTALSGGQHSPESVQSLADSLSQLTVRELSDLKKQYGISAAGRSKADLVAKVADRLSRGRREAEQQPAEPEPDVYAPESLFSMNQGLVNALASKMGDRHQQDELRQVGRIALWEAAQKWKPDGGTKFSTFAYTGISQAIKNAQRSEGRQKSKAQEFGVDEEGGDQSQQVPGRDSAPDEDMEKQEQLGQLQDAMKQLQSKSPDAAKMVMMKFSGQKLSEIAAEFGITEQGASQAVSRAVKKLQTMMGADKMQRTGDIVRYMDAWIRERYAAKPIAAGLCIQAADTGRVLMLQRSWDEDDDAAGTWEFPGGHIEDGETPLEAAKREWAEETGHKVPKGELVGEWQKGIYVGHVLRVKSEDAIELNMDSEDRHVQNPDDPDGDGIEVVAWWQPEQMKNNPALREELRRDKAKWLPLIQGVEKYAMETDHNEQAALIADILAHIYGDEAATILDAPDQYNLPQQMDMWIRERYGRQWDESQVKRDEKGRFATRAGKLANVATSIKNALQQPKTPQSAKALADELSQLTVKELTDLKKQYQISASGRTKADLVQKLASRLDMGRREEPKQRPEMADPAETLDADFVDDHFNGDMGAAIEAMESNRAEQISTAAKRGVEYDTDEIDADWMAEISGMAEEESEPEPAKPPANLLGDDDEDDEPFALQQPRKGRKQEKFETAPSGPQKALFDTGKNDLEGQNLLFNSDAGAGEDDPTTMENRMKGKANSDAKAVYRVGNKEFATHTEAVKFAKGIDADVFEIESGKRRWTPGKKPSAKRMRQYEQQKAAYEAQQRAIEQKRKQKADKLQSTIPRDRYSHLSPRGERIERLVAMVAAGFEQFVNMAGAAGSGVPLLDQPPTPINPWNAAYADATNQDTDKQLSRYERKSSGWITLNAEDGEGTKVYIGEGGEVTAGPKGMTGKKLNGDKPKKSAGKQSNDSGDDPFEAPSRSEAATDADDDWRFETQKIPWQARKAVDEVAEMWGVDGDDMIPLAQEKLQTELANWETREAVKKHARKSLGLNSRVTADMENGRSKRGEDFANLSGLDEFITEAQSMYPDFNWGKDPAQSLMEAVHEGAKPKPKLHDKSILDSAARYLFQTGQVAEVVPFSMLTHFPKTRYSRTVAFDSFCDEFLENALKSLTS